MYKQFKESTIYQIYLRSFQDSDGDGIGDLEGVIERLPLIAKLGIDYIWISPFYKSHQHDNGYDVDDYMSIDPLFGDFDVFDRLVEEARKYDIKIMLDMVFNHSSTYHEWFQKALSGDKKYMDYYIFKDNEGKVPTNWESKFGGSAWKYVESLDKYYLHLFHEKQADLNWKNPDLRAEIVEILKFWKNKGVRGFRFDVINLISKPDVYEDDHEGVGKRMYTDGPMVQKYLFEVFDKVEMEDAVTVGELSSTTIEKSSAYTNPENGALDMAFNFHHLKVDYKDGDKWTIGEMDFKAFFNLLDKWQSKVQELGGWSAWFMNNHDQPRAISRFGDVENYHYEVSTAIATLTHMMRGTPYVFQGEEIGMKNPSFNSIDDYKDVESINYYKILTDDGMSQEDALYALGQRSRDNGRIPVRWDDSPNGGFTEGQPWIKASPNSHINYEDAIKDSDSIFYFYKDLIKLRKDYKAIQDGKYKSVFISDDLYAFTRTRDQKSILVIISMRNENVDIDDTIKSLIKEESNILLNNYDKFDNEKLLPYQSLVIKL